MSTQHGITWQHRPFSNLRTWVPAAVVFRFPGHRRSMRPYNRLCINHWCDLRHIERKAPRKPANPKSQLNPLLTATCQRTAVYIRCGQSRTESLKMGRCTPPILGRPRNRTLTDPCTGNPGPHQSRASPADRMSWPLMCLADGRGPRSKGVGAGPGPGRGPNTPTLSCGSPDLLQTERVAQLRIPSKAPQLHAPRIAPVGPGVRLPAVPRDPLVSSESPSLCTMRPFWTAGVANSPAESGRMIALHEASIDWEYLNC